MDSQVVSEASFSEFFQSLREEAEFYVKAHKPPPSVKVRRLSPGKETTRLEALEQDNERLAERVRELEAENALLRSRGSSDKYANRLAAALNRLEGTAPRAEKLTQRRCKSKSEVHELEWRTRESLPTSMSDSLEAIQILELPLSPEKSSEDEVTRLRSEVSKHKAFIHHLKRSLQDLLIERLQEREEHLRTKSRLDDLLKRLGSKA